MGDELGKLRRVCDMCGGPVKHPEHAGRPRRYCDDTCAYEAMVKRARDNRHALKASKSEA